MNNPNVSEYSPENGAARQIIDSGVADRMLEIIKKFSDWSDEERSFGVDDCNFNIKKRRDSKMGRIKIVVVVEMPNLRSVKTIHQSKVITRAFAVEKGQAFGVHGEAPLTDLQYKMIMELAELVEG